MINTLAMALMYFKDVVNPSNDKELEYYYQLFPNMEEVHSHWNVFNQFFQQVYKKETKIFYTKASGGSWISLKDSYIVPDQVETNMGLVIEEFMLCEHENIVSNLPHFLRKMLLPENDSPYVNESTPKVVRKIVKKSDFQNEFFMDRKKVISIFEYCISDLSDKTSFNSLHGCQFLPLLNGFGKILKRSSNFLDFYFISSSPHDISLFPPSVQARFVDPSLDKHTLSKILSIAESGALNITIIDHQVFCSILKEYIFKPEW